MADKRTVQRAFNAAKEKAFHAADPDGSWAWRPSAFDAFRLGYEAAERKNKKNRGDSRGGEGSGG